MNPAEFESLAALVVDGHSQSGQLLRAILRTLGMSRVDVAAGAEAALKAMREESYNIVLCDMDEMGDESLAFSKSLRRDSRTRFPAVPVIIISGALQRRQVELMRDCGANGVLVRPMSVETVARKLRAVLFAPKAFVSSTAFVGPDRRGSGERAPFDGVDRRRGKAPRPPLAGGEGEDGKPARRDPAGSSS